MEKEQGQQRALPAAADLYLAAIETDLERTEDQEPHPPTVPRPESADKRRLYSGRRFEPVTGHSRTTRRNHANDLRVDL
jgi:hypothetical protein